jgi:hypothetical protein
MCDEKVLMTSIDYFPGGEEASLPFFRGGKYSAAKRSLFEGKSQREIISSQNSIVSRQYCALP